MVELLSCIHEGSYFFHRFFKWPFFGIRKRKVEMGLPEYYSLRIKNVGSGAPEKPLSSWIRTSILVLLE